MINNDYELANNGYQLTTKGHSDLILIFRTIKALLKYIPAFFTSLNYIRSPSIQR
jgi:hypothetical protein